MPNWLIAISIVMSLCTMFGCVTYKNNSNCGMFGDAFGILGMFLFIVLGIIISIAIVVTKFLL